MSIRSGLQGAVGGANPAESISEAVIGMSADSACDRPVRGRSR